MIIHRYITVSSFFSEELEIPAEAIPLLTTGNQLYVQDKQGYTPNASVGLKSSITRMRCNITRDGELSPKLAKLANKRMIDLDPQERALLLSTATTVAEGRAFIKGKGCKGIGDGTMLTILNAIDNLPKLATLVKAHVAPAAAPLEQPELSISEPVRECTERQQPSEQTVQEMLSDLSKTIGLLAQSVQDLQRRYTEEKIKNWGVETSDRAAASPTKA